MRNIGNPHYQGNTQQPKPPMGKQNKDNLKKEYGGNPHEIGPSILGESKERGTTSKSFGTSQPSPSANLDSHQTKGNKLQLPAAFPEINHNLQETKKQLSLCLAKDTTNKSQSIINNSIERAEIHLAKLKQLKRKMNSIMDYKQIDKNFY